MIWVNLYYKFAYGSSYVAKIDIPKVEQDNFTPHPPKM